MNTLYRKKSLEKIESPEQLDQYLHVTGPSVWIILSAVIVLLAGIIIWSFSSSVESYISCTASVYDGNITVVFDDEKNASYLAEGNEIVAGNSTAVIESIGTQADGTVFATAKTDLPDGVYEVRVVYRRTQLLKLLLN